MATTSFAEKPETLIQPSSVNPLVGFNEGLFDTTTNWSVPLKLNACPTSPLANVVPLTSAPEFASTASSAFPSAFHQLMRPEATATQLVEGDTLFRHLPAPSTA